jgi:hypothetical protein
MEWPPSSMWFPHFVNPALSVIIVPHNVHYRRTIALDR